MKAINKDKKSDEPPENHHNQSATTTGMTTTKTRDPIGTVCSSASLDQFLSVNTELKVSYAVPLSTSAEYVSEMSTDMPITDLEPSAIGIMAGLGIKRKSPNESSNSSGKKPKTLSEKRENLERDIIKYGLATVKKMYPRQPTQDQMRHFLQKRQNSTSASRSGFKMKPKPSGLEFEEIDARRILRPYSHDKYIHEPQYASVVYISRRTGLVPLSSLCKDSKTILTSDTKLLQERNSTFGKPRIFFQNQGRLVALGGSRSNSTSHSFKIIKLPQLVSKSPEFKKARHRPQRQRTESACDFIPFKIDLEYAKIITEAIDIPDWYWKKPGKVDIRAIKRQKKLHGKGSQASKTLSSSNIVDHMLDKIQRAQSMEIENTSRVGKDSKEDVIFDLKDLGENNVKSEEVKAKDEKKEIKEEEMEEEEDSNFEQTYDIKFETQGKNTEIKGAKNEPLIKQEEKQIVPKLTSSSHQTFNAWSSNIPLQPLPDIENRPIVTEEFRKKFEERKKNNSLAGLDVCDVEDCFCKEDWYIATSAITTEIPTPASGAQTPSTKAQEDERSSDKKVKSKLKKVKRALKSLGVNFYEFDDPDDTSIQPDDKNIDHGKPLSCHKEFCRLGCICDTLSRKAVAPAHCGRVECMLWCNCSEDAINFTSSKKVGISTAGAVNLRSSSQRHLAAEERKFHNTVVATSGGQDLLMLGSAGRQKRERKLPSRYQDRDLGVSEASSKDIHGNTKRSFRHNYTDKDPAISRMIAECLKDETIKKCITVLPRFEVPPDTAIWCMFHCQYDCQCSSYENPIDYAPAKSTGSHEKPVKKTKHKKKSTQVQVNKSHGHQQKKQEKTEPTLTNGHIEEPSILSEHSSRTAGYRIKPSKKVRVPHKVVIERKMNDLPHILKKKTLYKATVKHPTVLIDKSKVTLDAIPVENETVKEERKVNLGLEDAGHQSLNLSIQPKGTIQYIKWNVFKKSFLRSEINIYVFHRASRPLVFVTKSNEAPYVTNAEEMKNIAPERLSSLPSTHASLLSPVLNEDDNKFAILTHNGIAWELTGQVQKKTSTPSVTIPSSTLSPSQQLSQTVNGDLLAQNLNQGVHVVTLQRKGKTTIQIRLPVTQANQHWCTIRVDEELSAKSVPCPDSHLVLKTAVLREAATLAMKEKTTVRIPISVIGEVASFGVYAVPGLGSHVFVGPFTSTDLNKQDSNHVALDDDVVCLGPPNIGEKRKACGNQEGNDEIQMVSAKDKGKIPSKRRKQHLEERKDPSEEDVDRKTIVNEIVGKLADKAVSVGEKRFKRAKERGSAIGGPVPCLVSKPSCDDDVVTVEENDQTDNLKPQSEILKESNASLKFPYTNLVQSKFGKVVRKAEELSQIDESMENPKIKGKFYVLNLKMKPQGVVTFPHPKFPKHEVFSASIDDAQAWLQEFEKNEFQKEDKSKDLANAGLKQKRKTSEQMAMVGRKLGKVETYETGDGVIKRRQEIIGPEGSRGFAIFLDTRMLREHAKLFYNLSNVLNRGFFTKSLSKVQIIQKATEEIKRLNELDKDLQQKKKNLMLTRKSLFSRFTEALDGLPIEIKKQKLQELKNIVKKKDQDSSRNSNHDGSPVTEISSKTSTTFIKNSLPSLPPGLPKQTSAKYLPETSVTTKSKQPDIIVKSLPYAGSTEKSDGKVMMRPINAFMVWAKDQRNILIAQGYDEEGVSKILTDEWKKIPKDQKQKYYDEAARLKNMHQLQHPDYIPKPKTNVPPTAITSTETPFVSQPSSSGMVASQSLFRSSPTNPQNRSKDDRSNRVIETISID